MSDKITYEYTYLNEWRDDMKDIIRMRFPEDRISDKQIDKLLDGFIKERMKNPNMLVVNNYTNKVSRMNLLKLIDLIRSNSLITAGGGCLFLQHSAKRNILIEFILYIMDSRSAAKKRRAQFKKGTDEWDEADRDQLAFKLVINSLYGCLGYAGFIMFNIFLAEAITNQGKHIITSAINAIENFLGDCMQFTSASEVYHVIHNIENEFYQRTKGRFSDALITQMNGNFDLTKLPEMCTKRFLDHCIFAYDKGFAENLYAIFNNMSTDELIMMYFKNNFMEFNRLDFMKVKIKTLIIENGPLSFSEDWCYKDDHCRDLVNEIWQFYEIFILYDYPVYDRIRKAMYIDKRKSLYTDTDSVFISVDEFVQYCFHDVFQDKWYEDTGMDEKDFNFTCANIAFTFIGRMIAKALATLCASLNITPDFAKLLKMKNEFLFSRIMFSDVKKRYISLAMLQEGQLLGDGEGYPEIKGFDFIKAGTKPYVKEYYEKICVEEILKPKEIDPARIFRKVLALKSDMETTIMSGNMQFFKQSNVKKPEYYKNPFSTQGVCAIMLWNALVPDKSMEFPNDINVVPIRELTYPKQTGKKIKGPLDYKNIKAFADKYPEYYRYLYENIYSSENPLIRHMNLSSIAIPKRIDYDIPDYIKYLWDVDGVVNDTMNLILPILKGVGINSLPVTSNTSYMSNMVSL